MKHVHVWQWQAVGRRPSDLSNLCLLTPLLTLLACPQQFYLHHLPEYDVDCRYFNPEYGTDLADEKVHFTITATAVIAQHGSVKNLHCIAV